MARSLKKGPYVHYSLIKKVQRNLDSNKKTVVKTWSRASMIIPDFVGGKQLLFIMDANLFLYM